MRVNRDRLLLLAITALAVAHALAIAPHYVVGSFDDDGHYLALGQSLLHGRGFVDTSAPGSPAETLYPPGYPALLVPLLWIGRGATWVLRGFNLLLFAASVPLMSRLLRRFGVTERVRIAALGLYALNPVAATFATMVMTELPFIVTLLVVLIALPGWLEQDSPWGWRGLAVALGAPYLVALKIAGVPITVAVLLWPLIKRRPRHFVVALAGAGLELIPIVVYRFVGGSVVGQRYSSDYKSSGGLVHATVHGVGELFSAALPNSIVPVGALHLSRFGPLFEIGGILRWTAGAFVVLGLIRWVRMRLDVIVLIVPLYLIEVLPFPFVNERRIILVLPLVLAWWVLGVDGALLWIQARWARRRRVPTWAKPASIGVVAVTVSALLAVQISRDYLIGLGQTTPAERGSNYIAALRIADPPGWSIATGYRWTTSLWTGRTASNVASFDLTCTPGEPGSTTRLHQILMSQHDAVDLSSVTKFPGVSDSECVALALPMVRWAVPVFSGTDSSTIWELLGPGTPRADESSLPTHGAQFENTHNDVIDEISLQVTGAGTPRLLAPTRSNDHSASLRPLSIVPRSARGFYDWTVPAAMSREISSLRVAGVASDDLEHFVVLGHKAR